MAPAIVALTDGIRKVKKNKNFVRYLKWREAFLNEPYLFSAVFGDGDSRIHTAYIGEDSSILGTTSMFGDKRLPTIQPWKFTKSTIRLSWASQVVSLVWKWKILGPVRFYMGIMYPRKVDWKRRFVGN